MVFLSSMLGLYRAFSITKSLSNLFIDSTAQLLDTIGQKEFDAAIRCLHDSEISNNREREFNMAITLLKGSFEKFSYGNELKFQCAAIISICYYALADIKLSDTYIKLSKVCFEKWIYKSMPVTTSYALFNLMHCREFRRELSKLGLKWKGYPYIPFISCANSIVMNVEIDLVCRNAIQDYNKKMDRLFLSPPKYYFHCPKCNEKKEFIKLTSSETQEMFFYLNPLNLSAFKCSVCGERITINEDNDLELDNDGNFTKKTL